MKKAFAAELQEVIDRASPEVREHATKEIGKLRRAGIDSFEALASAAKDLSLPSETRMSACWLLGQLGQKQAVSALLTAFADDSLSWEAAKALAAINSKRAIKPLIDSLVASRTIDQRSAAAYALGLLADNRALEPLVRVLDDAKVNPEVRGHAAEALGQLGDNRAASHLIAALKDRSVEVRFWASFALGQLRNRKALPELKRVAVEDRGVLPRWGKVREAAQDAIRNIERTNDKGKR